MPCADEMVPGPHPGDPGSRHLWVMGPDGIPVVLESVPELRPPMLHLGVAKHTNLTGGDPACCGGEAWVHEVDEGHLFLNGGSGRYPARTPEELAEAVSVFESFGYTVTSAGWSYENDWPERVFR